MVQARAQGTGHRAQGQDRDGYRNNRNRHVDRESDGQGQVQGERKKLQGRVKGTGEKVKNVKTGKQGRRRFKGTKKQKFFQKKKVKEKGKVKW